MYATLDQVFDTFIITLHERSRITTNGVSSYCKVGRSNITGSIKNEPKKKLHLAKYDNKIL